MFHVHCPRCGRAHLLGSRRILSVHPTSTGHTVYLRCFEGHTLVTEVPRLAGRASTAARPAA